MKQKISKSTINSLRIGRIIVDTAIGGFVARRLKSGRVSYGFRHFDKATGKQPWIGLGLHGDITPEQARRRALKVAGQIKDGDKPVSAAAQATQRREAWGYTVDQMLDDFVARHVRDKLRSADEIERVFKVYVRPKLGTKSVHDLKRLDIIELLDGIEDGGAPVMADRVLAHFRKALRWYATRDETFAVPIVPGMARTKPTERARKRVLDDQEIRDLYAALDGLGDSVPKCFPKFVRALLLTAQRLRMVSNMPWGEIDGGEWTVPEARHKGKGKGDHFVPLTDEVLALIGDKGKGFVFSSDGGKTPFSGFSKAKAALDAKLVGIRKAAGRKPMQPWVFHDLRRTARSLMSRAGVPSDHAEQVLAHVIGGVRGVYDRHEYAAEKRDALEKLAALVERILQPGAKVVRLPKRARKAS